MEEYGILLFHGMLPMVIRNHPKMVKRWAKRVMEVRAAFGRETAEKWASQLFDKDTIMLVAEELKKQAGVKA